MAESNFQVVGRGFNLPVAVARVGLGARLFFANLPVEKKKNTVPLGECLWGPVKGDTVDAALRGWAFNNSVTGPGNIRPGSLYSPAEVNIQPSLQREPGSLKLCPLLTLSLRHQIALPSSVSFSLFFFFFFFLQHSLGQLFDITDTPRGVAVHQRCSGVKQIGQPHLEWTITEWSYAI